MRPIALAILLLTAPAVLAQERPIVPQDSNRPDPDNGPTGWVQAPIPRGVPGNAADSQGTTHAQAPASTEAQAPISSALPGPSGVAAGEPKTQ